MKKHFSIKRVFGLILAMVVMAGTISAQALAASTWDDTRTEGTLKINKTDQEGHSIAGAGYTIYKVADIVQNGSEMSYDTSAYPHGIAVSGSTIAADFDGISLDPYGSEKVTDGVNSLLFESLPLGIYLVKETTTPAGVIASNDFIVSIPMTDPTGEGWVYDVFAEPKNTVFNGSVSKTVISDTTEESNGVWTVNVGEEIEYQITVIMPSDFYDGDPAKDYTQFDVYDIPSTGLKIDVGSVRATVNGVEVAAGVAGTPTDPSDPNGFTVSLVKDGQTVNPLVEAGATVVITYKATVTAEGIGKDITNAAAIKYDYEGSNGPGTEEPDPEKPIPTLHTYSHAVLKVDGSNSSLSQAEFVVKLSNDKYLRLNNTSDGWIEVDDQAEATVFVSGGNSPLTTYTAEGYFAIAGVKGGTHQLIETKAPEGYTLLKAPVSVDFDDMTTGVQQSEGYTTTIVNVTGFTLPGTGGAGIIIYIAAGIALVAIGLVLYAKRRSLAGKK